MQNLICNLDKLNLGCKINPYSIFSPKIYNSIKCYKIVRNGERVDILIFDNRGVNVYVVIFFLNNLIFVLLIDLLLF